MRAQDGGKTSPSDSPVNDGAGKKAYKTPMLQRLKDGSVRHRTARAAFDDLIRRPDDEKGRDDS